MLQILETILHIRVVKSIHRCAGPLSSLCPPRLPEVKVSPRKAVPWPRWHDPDRADACLLTCAHFSRQDEGLCLPRSLSWPRAPARNVLLSPRFSSTSQVSALQPRAHACCTPLVSDPCRMSPCSFPADGAQSGKALRPEDQTRSPGTEAALEAGKTTPRSPLVCTALSASCPTHQASCFRENEHKSGIRSFYPVRGEEDKRKWAGG